jgi:hypothetical protein
MFENDNVLRLGCVWDSITEPSEAGRSFSANLSGKRKSKRGSVLKAWHFQLMVKADLHNAKEIY